MENKGYQFDAQKDKMLQKLQFNETIKLHIHTLVCTT